MLLRFRLFSDPFANGWGWVIEDLKIIPLIDAKHEIVTWHVGIYPNPGHGLIKLSTDSPERESYKPIRYKIFNGMGICIVSSTTSGSYDSIIDISNYPSGIYIILLYFDNGTYCDE